MLVFPKNNDGGNVQEMKETYGEHVCDPLRDPVCTSMTASMERVSPSTQG